MKISNVLLMTWCCLTALIFSAAQGKTQNSDPIDEQLYNIRSIQDTSGMKLSGNEAFHDWLMTNSE